MVTSIAGKYEIVASASRGTSIVARIWRGRTRIQNAAEYQRYLYENGVLKIEHMPGNIGVIMYQAQDGDVCEFTVMSFWPDRASIESWAGSDINKTRHLERDPDFLLSLPRTVEHVDVFANDWILPELLSKE
jgi:heme-degrading monooxygenase HmoA